MYVGIGKIMARLKHELSKDGIDPEDVRLMVEGSKSIPKEWRDDLKVKVRMMHYMVAEKMNELGP
jgi:hypothetical protein